jgi:integrase
VSKINCPPPKLAPLPFDMFPVGQPGLQLPFGFFVAPGMVTTSAVSLLPFSSWSVKAATNWLEKRAGLASNTRETYEGALKHLREILGTMLVCEIEARDIVIHQKARLVQSAAGATINKEIACLSSILGDCGVWQQVRRDVKRLDENEEAGRALSRDEEKRLLECASVIGRHFGNWTPLYTVTVLGLNTGMRHKEIRTLKWKNLDLASRVLRVGESKTEAGKGRPIPLTQTCVGSPRYVGFPLPRSKARAFRLSRVRERPH